MPADSVTPETTLAADLESLLSLATEVVVAEERLEALARRIRADELWWGLDPLPCAPAVFGQIEAALRHAEECSDGDYLNTCQQVQNAIDVLAFSMGRRSDREAVTADAR